MNNLRLFKFSDNMLKETISALWAFPAALKFIFKYRLWFYVWIPGLASILLGALILWGALGVSDDIGRWVIDFYPWERGRNWIEAIAQGLGGLLVAIVGLILFKHLVLAVSSPVMSLLSEKVERITRGGAGAKFNLGKAIQDTVRGLRIALRNIVRELFFTLLLFLLGIIVPILSPFTTAMIFVIQAFYAGFGNMDFTLERYFGVKGSIRFVRQHKGLAIGNGIVFLLMLFTVVGFLFALPLCTIAAALTTIKQLPAVEESTA
jgi:CysZ protein